MGLDMYLTGERYLWGFPEDHPDVRKKTDIQWMFPELGQPRNPFMSKEVGFEIDTVTAKIGYWRKSNAIHKWFVDNVQDGVDDCGKYSVSWKDLDNLRAICQSVLETPERAPDLLPAQSGFFFGDTSYDEYYFDGLKRTVDIVDLIDQRLVIKEHKGQRYSEWDFYYQSSW
jgi:hypothetical protein